MSLPPKDHPVWRIIEKALVGAIGLALIAHGALDTVGVGPAAQSDALGGVHPVDVVGTGWLLREMIGWIRA